MENPRSARGGTLASKRPTLNKKRFIQYEPELVEELNQKKTGNQSVSGRLLTLIYKRLLFWSKYSKHQHNGRRYFWKSIPELSEELQYSEKQVSRGLRALVELGMIVREKLNKRNWKHTYYYYLPHSVQTPQDPIPVSAAAGTRNSLRSSSKRSCGASGSSTGGAGTGGTPLTVSACEASEGHQGAQERAVAVAGAGTLAAAPEGVSGSCPPSQQKGFSPAGAVKPFRQRQTVQNVRFTSIEDNPLLEKQLRTIVEKCLDYAINPPKPLTGGGFAAQT